MKAKNKVVLTSIASIALCSSLAVGGTYALFTGESKVNIAVTAGRVEVLATIDDDSLETYSLDVAQTAGSFQNGGSALFTSDQKLVLTNVTPGDEVKFNVVVENKSNVTIQYRLTWLLEGELANGLIATVGKDEEAKPLTSHVEAWDNWETTENSIKKIPVSVELPVDAGNEYQETEAEISFFVEAVQGNGITMVKTVNDLNAALNKGGNIALNNSIAGSAKTIKIPEGKTVSLDLNGYALSNMTGVSVAQNAEFTLKNANAPLKVDGKGTFTLEYANIQATAGNALELADNYEGKIVLKGYNTLIGATGCNGIYVPASATLDLSGTGTLVAKGNGGIEAKEDNATKIGGSGIGGEGAINVHDLASLTAEGYGWHAFGIGGNSASITIKNTNVKYVKGGFVQPNLVYDTQYGKTEPEGGAAIGSNYSGTEASVSLIGVTIEKAEGGSKAAGIGASYHTAVKIEIDGCTIKNVVGGNASAGIGGSRIRKDNAHTQTVTIDINNSTITAQGGEYGAGIGSGYDTYCHTHDVAPLTTINIKGESVINATGGKYAAGIGTGYHAGKLAGEIAESVTVKAVSGEKFYKDTYTQAQDVGFGVIDPSRDGKENTDTIIYKGEKIGIPAVGATN